MNDIHPFDWLAALTIWALEHGAALLLHISGNVAHLGLGWVLAYWLTIAGLLHLGGWGLTRIGKARRGNDFIEFANNRAGWTGQKTARLYEFFVKSEARLGFAVLGYPAAAILFAVGALGLWAFALLAGWILLRAAELRRARNRRLS